MLSIQFYFITLQARWGNFPTPHKTTPYKVIENESYIYNQKIRKAL